MYFPLIAVILYWDQLTNLVSIAEQFDLRHRSSKLTETITPSLVASNYVYVEWTHSGYCTVIGKRTYGHGRAFFRSTVVRHPGASLWSPIDMHPSSSALDCRYQLEGARQGTLSLN